MIGFYRSRYIYFLAYSSRLLVIRGGVYFVK